MTIEELVAFVHAHKLGVVATVAGQNRPEAALVGLAATSRGEIVFDTSRNSRKFRNLTSRTAIAVVVGWDDERTVQIEGVADIPEGDDLTRCQAAYFDVFPDGRERAEDPSLAHIRVRPSWYRYSDFNDETFEITDHRL